MKGHTAEITDLKFLKECNLLYSSDTAGELRISDLVKEKVVVGIKTIDEISSFGILGNTIVIASQKTIKLFDLRNRIVINAPDSIMQVSNDDINCIDLNYNHELIGIAQDQGQVIILDWRNKLPKRLFLHSNVASCIAFRPNSNWQVLSGGFDSKAIISDFSRGSIMSEFSFDQGLEENSGGMQINAPFVTSCKFNESGKKVLVGRFNGDLQLFESIKGSKKKENWKSKMVHGHRWAINSVLFDKDWILSTGLDGNISLWDSNLERISNLENKGQKFNSMALLESNGSSFKVAVGGFSTENKGKIFIKTLEKL